MASSPLAQEREIGNRGPGARWIGDSVPVGRGPGGGRGRCAWRLTFFLFFCLPSRVS